MSAPPNPSWSPRDRLSRIEGHVRGLRRMLAEHRECDDTVTQVSTVKSAVNQVAILLLEGDLETCVAEGLRCGDGTPPLVEKALRRYHRTVMLSGPLLLPWCSVVRSINPDCIG